MHNIPMNSWIFEALAIPSVGGRDSEARSARAIEIDQNRKQSKGGRCSRKNLSSWAKHNVPGQCLATL
jgi:hypothetical protein